MLYDLFRETAWRPCTRCGDEFPECDLMPLDGQFVCENCIKDKCDEHADELREDFIAAHRGRVLPRLLVGMISHRRIGCALPNRHTGRKPERWACPELEGDFCVDHEDWLSFAEGELEG